MPAHAPVRANTSAENRVGEPPGGGNDVAWPGGGVAAAVWLIYASGCG